LVVIRISVWIQDRNEGLPLPYKANLHRIWCYHLVNTTEKIDITLAEVCTLRVPL